jgi:peptidoglycan/xylan/chitin deacetylase (PgdA/CDA1 family)
MRLGRLVLPALAFALGTVVGVRHVGDPAWPLDGARALLGAHADAPPTSSSKDAPSPAPAKTIDESAVPDPVPWPHLNPTCTAHRAWLLSEGPAPAREDGRRLVTLTFDDGPYPDTTPEVLRVLDKFGVKATFFFVGRNFRGDPDRVAENKKVARRVIDAGHLVGGHGYAHVALPFVTRTRALAEIDDGLDAVERATGKRPALFRPPYGQLDGFGEEAIRTRGLELVLWSIAADDETEVDGLYLALRNQIAYAGGGIVLLHDIRPVTAPALAKLLGWVRAHAFDAARPERVGYEVVDLVTYLRATGEHPQPFEDRAALEKARAEAWSVAHPKRPAPVAGTGEGV